jgi:hypothetical protein
MIRVATVTITRPDNATAYSIGDRICTTTGTTDTGSVFLGLGETMYGNGYVTKCKLFTNASGFTAALRLHLYTLASGQTIAAGTTVGDNVAISILYADASKYVGFIDLTTWVSTAGSTFSIVDTERLCFQSAAFRGELAGRGTFVGILEARGGFTPAASQQFQIELTTDAYEG